MIRIKRRVECPMCSEVDVYSMEADFVYTKSTLIKCMGSNLDGCGKEFIVRVVPYFEIKKFKIEEIKNAQK